MKEPIDFKKEAKLKLHRKKTKKINRKNRRR